MHVFVIVCEEKREMQRDGKANGKRNTQESNDQEIDA
jgi:hypothetical protein